MNPRARLLLGLVFVVASLTALGMSARATIQYSRYAHCQSAVTDALIRSQLARADAAAQDRESDRDETAAVTTLIDAVFHSTTPEQSRAAYATYQARVAAIAARRAETDATRRANPLPAPPSQTCG